MTWSCRPRLPRVHADWFEQYEDLYAPKTAELIRRGQSVSP